LENDYKEEIYTHIEKEGKINLVWHQVMNMDANERVLDLLNTTKGVTVISPTWFSLIDNEGNFSSLASEKYVNRAHKAGVEVWALIDDFDKHMKVGEVLGYTSKRERLIKGLISQAIKYDLDGINIDFEHIREEGGEDFTQFIRELSVRCRQNGIVLSIDNFVPSPFKLQYDREEQGIVADYIVIMGYDEHYQGGGVSGSVSSLGFVVDAVQNTLEQVPPERVIMGLPFYTRLWKEESDGDGIKVTSEAYGMNGAENKLREFGVEAQWDDETGQLYAEFDSGGIKHKIWLEEEKSLEEKLKVVMEQDVAGVAFWKLGLERDSIWDVIIKHLN
jgi:spore germination protein YaaH